MPLQHYGVLKGKAIAAKREDGQTTPHYQVHILAGTTHYRVAVNVKSADSPSELMFLVDDAFKHPITAHLADLPDGFSELASAPGGQALDFIRGNLFDRTQMKILPPSCRDRTTT